MKITIIGCGIIGGALARHFAPNHTITLYDKNYEQSHRLSLEINALAVQDPYAAVEHAEIIVLAVKPQYLNAVAEVFGSLLKEQQLFISVLMGTPISHLKQCFPSPTIVRIMPNTPMIYKQGVLGVVEDPLITAHQKQLINSLFFGLGLIYWVPEEKIDAITALTASLPAYIYVIVEAMIDAGIYLGFPSADTKALVVQAVEGSLKVLKDSGKSPCELKWEVTSPGGNTIGGILEMEKHGIRAAIMETILAGYDKIKQTHRLD